MSVLDFAGATDVGPIRSENQDRWVADPQQGLFLVADGIGLTGHGSLAADIVAAVLPPLIQQRLADTTDGSRSVAVNRILDAVREVSERLWSESWPRFGASVPGSTVVLALIRRRSAIVAHLGDSRAYLLRARKLCQLTRDHNLLQALLDSGSITAEEAQSHPARAQLTRFVGMKDKPVPEARFVPLTPRDRLLLSTDGLHGCVSQQRLEAILAQPISASQICRQLIDTALQAGSEDNITAVVIDFQDT
jgi:serine/threonine protein phosphatase PrpC